MYGLHSYPNIWNTQDPMSSDNWVSTIPLIQYMCVHHHLPILQYIFNVVVSCVYEHSQVIPTTALHSNVFMHCTQTLQLLVTNSNICIIQNITWYLYYNEIITFLNKGRVALNACIKVRYRWVDEWLTVLAQDSDMIHVLCPYHILSLTNSHTSQRSTAWRERNNEQQ